VDEPTEIPLLGTAAFTLNGIPIFGPNEAERPDPYGDPVYNGIVDMCKGHTGGGGTYHYHALLAECITPDRVSDGAPSPIIGYALDGFPIYGPFGCLDAECSEVVKFESGWVQTGDPTTYAWDNHEYMAQDSPTVLDECNGRFGPNGDYRYHATDTFPYILGCYHGVANTGGGGMMGGGGDDGACTSDADCEAGCDSDLGCACVGTMMGGDVCVPRCDSNDDCGQNEQCTMDNVCRARRM